MKSPINQAIDHSVVPKERPSEDAWKAAFNAPQGRKEPLPGTNDEVIVKYYLREDKEGAGAYMDDPKEDHLEPKDKTLDPWYDSLEARNHINTCGGHSKY